MRSFVPFRFRRQCLAAVILHALLLLGAPLAAQAALASDQTVLYYLIEMQRRVKKNCGGKTLPEAPSLIPSGALRDIAEQCLASGRQPESLAASSGLGALPFLALSASGNSPQQAFDALKAAQCPALMGPDYRYVGAASSGGRWVVILSAAEPGSGAGGGPAGAMPAPAGEPAPSDYPEPGPLPDDAYNPGEPPQPGSWGGPGDLRIPKDRLQEAAPAAPVIVGEMQLDASGKAHGPVFAHPGDPVAAPPLVPTVDFSPQSWQEPPGPEAARTQGQSPEQQEAAAYPPSFVPPEAPGPFGVSRGGAAAAPPEKAGRQGVVQLQDSRPALPEGPMVYVAPEKGEEAGISAGTSEVRGGAFEATGALQGPSGEATMLELVNKVRARGGNCGSEYLPPAQALAPSALLAGAAQNHARDMAARRYFSSTTPEGVTLGRRLTAAGYDWGLVAENIASLDGSAEEVLRSWMAEPRQCQNIMAGEYQEAGFGRDPSGTLWVFTLAAPVESGAIRLR